MNNTGIESNYIIGVDPYRKPPSTADKIKEECEDIMKTLLEKNRKYGDSAFNSGELFNVPPITAIKARINDKVSRIKAAQADDLEDPIKDLIGYLILLRVAMKDII